MLNADQRIFGFVIILVVGWFIATLIAKAVQALLHATNFNGLAQRAGIADVARRMNVKTDSAGLMANIIKWFIRLIVMVVAVDAFGLPAVSAVLTQFLLWVANLIVALVVIVLGDLAAQAVSELVRGATSEAGFTNPDLIAMIAKTAVWIFTIVIAVNQIGTAVTLANTLFTGFVAAFAIALGLPFGLGGKDTAAKIVSKWYAESDATASRIESTSNAARNELDRRP